MSPVNKSPHDDNSFPVFALVLLVAALFAVLISHNDEDNYKAGDNGPAPHTQEPKKQTE